MTSEMEKYKTLVEVFKGYFDTALTANIWFYAFTGGIVTYYLSHKPIELYLKYSLLLPAVLGVLLISRSLFGMRQAYKLENAMLLESNSKTEDKSPKKKGKDAPLLCILFNRHEPSVEPPIEILVGYLRATVISASLVIAGLIFLICCGSVFLFKD